MAISDPKREVAGMLEHAACGWRGTSKDLNEVEGFCCPKCGEPLFPPEWLEKEPTT